AAAFWLRTRCANIKQNPISAIAAAPMRRAGDAAPAAETRVRLGSSTPKRLVHRSTVFLRSTGSAFLVGSEVAGGIGAHRYDQLRRSAVERDFTRRQVARPLVPHAHAIAARRQIAEAKAATVIGHCRVGLFVHDDP